MSRGKCRRRALATETQSREPLSERRERDVEKPDLEHGQERDRNVLLVLNRKPNEVGEINGERHLSDREKRLERHVFAGTPRLGFALDPVFRRAREIRYVIEDRLEDRPGIIERKTDAKGQQGGQQKNFLHPG